MKVLLAIMAELSVVISTYGLDLGTLCILRDVLASYFYKNIMTFDDIIFHFGAAEIQTCLSVI